jgi:hypothetical protein
MKRKLDQTCDEKETVAVAINELQQDTDYGWAPIFSDLAIECSDGRSLHYFKGLLARGSRFGFDLGELFAGTAEPLGSAGRIAIPFAAPTVNCFLNWLDLGRSTLTRMMWVGSKDLAQLLDLGRLGRRYGSTLASECAAAIRVSFDTARAQVEDLAKFAVETGVPLRTFFGNSRPFSVPTLRRLPDWPQAIWAAFLEADGSAISDQMIRMLVTLHADIEPDSKLRQAVKNDLDTVMRLARPKRREMLDGYWSLLNQPRESKNIARTVWLLEFARYFMDLADQGNIGPGLIQRQGGLAPVSGSPVLDRSAPASGSAPVTSGPEPVAGRLGPASASPTDESKPAACGLKLAAGEPEPVVGGAANGSKPAAGGPEPLISEPEPPVREPKPTASEPPLTPVAHPRGPVADALEMGPPKPTASEPPPIPVRPPGLVADIVQEMGLSKPTMGPPKPVARRGRRPTDRARRAAKAGPK